MSGYKPQATLFVIVDMEEGTHHGTFDALDICEDEAVKLRDETGWPHLAIYAYKRGKKLSVVPSVEETT